MTIQEITIHTDGCCLGNPGKGGYAAVVRRYKGGTEIKKRVVTGAKAMTTNNQMEMKAAIEGLRQLSRSESDKITVYSDSLLLVRGMNEWLPNWQARNWRSSSGKPAANQELWKELLAASEGLQVNWQWVRGHNGEPHNEEADGLANAAAERA